MSRLYWNTVNGLLRSVLEAAMAAPELAAFRLVGGTSLSLQIGHRKSFDIDLFTDADYGTVNFAAIDHFFRSHFRYVETTGGPVGIGTSCFIGEDEQHAVKADLYYTDSFIQPAMAADGVRLATVEEILAMKLDIIGRGGRKKDFWDVHALIDNYTLEDMLELHRQRYPYSHERDLIYRNMSDFREADNDFDPVCLRGGHWELIKYDLTHWADLGSHFHRE